MIQFAQFQYIWLCLLVPFILIVFGLMMMWRRKLLARFGNITLVRQLMPLASVTRAWVKMILFSLALLFFFIGLTRPQLGASVREVKQRGIEIIVALDVSNSMLAEDYKPNRLERAKLAISKLVDASSGDRVGLIVFAGDAYVQLPLTADYVSAKIFLNSINPGIVPKQGTAIGSAVNLAMRSFTDQSDKSRVLIIISDGENHEDDPVAMAKEAQEMGIVVYTIGIGSAKGSVINVGGDMLRDVDGQPVVTKLNEELLVQIAEAGGGLYTHATNADLGLMSILDNVKQMEKDDLSSVVFTEYDELYMYFFGIALFFLLLEVVIFERKNKWLTKIDIFQRRE